MKRVFVIGLSMLFLLSIASAQELPDPGITPDNFLYGLDRAIESLQKAFTHAPEDRAKLALQLAAERLAEMKEMERKGKPDFASSAAEDYEDELEEAETNGKKISELAKKKDFEGLVANATFIHVEVLEGVLEKVPEQAKPAIQRAMERSKTGHDNALDRLGEVEPGESARLRFRYVERRLNRTRERAERADAEEIEDLIEEYEDELNETDDTIERGRALGKNVTALAEHVCAMRYKHIEVLEGILEKVPDPAKPAIEHTIDVSLERHANCTERILERINKTVERQKSRICESDEDCEELDIYCPTNLGFELICYIPENKTEGRCRCSPEWKKTWFNCTSDAECRELVCPMMIGCDTPICEEGRCKCGGKWQLNTTEWKERFREEWSEEIEERTERMRESYSKTGTEEILGRIGRP